MDFKSKDLNVTLMTITVELASEIISKMKDGDNYRKVKQHVVNMYARDMEDNKWMFCGNTLCFDKEGKCINGQHTCYAIIKSGKSQKMVVVMGLDPETSLVMDIGYKRSVEDYLKKQGAAYENGATAIVKRVMGMKRGNKCSGHSAANIDGRNTRIVDAYAEDEYWYCKAARYAKKINSESGKALKPTDVGSIFYYLIRVLGVDKDKVEDFFFRLCNARRNEKSIFNTTVSNLSDKDFLKRSGTRATDEYIKCWNAFIHGCTVKRQDYSDWFEKPASSAESAGDVEFATAAM